MTENLKSQLKSIEDRIAKLVTPQGVHEKDAGEVAELASMHEALTTIGVDLPTLMDGPVHNRRG